MSVGAAAETAEAAACPAPPTTLDRPLNAPPTRAPTDVVRRYSTTRVVTPHDVMPWNPPVVSFGRPERRLAAYAPIKDATMPATTNQRAPMIDNADAVGLSSVAGSRTAAPIPTPS